MKKLIGEILSWGCLAVILGAALGHPLALRMEGSAAVLVGIMNALLVVVIVAMLVPGTTQELAELNAKQSPARRAYLLFSHMLWLAVLMFAGWQWSFGIRAFWLVVKMSVVEKRDAR